MIVKRFAPGVPDGYAPQRQSVPDNPYVLISEWARGAAHELDDKSSRWLNSRDYDEFFDENPSETQVRETLDHVALLMSYESVKEYLPKIHRDFLLIKAYIVFLNQTVGYIARRKVSDQQWAMHKRSMQEEHAYKEYLYRILKDRLAQFKLAIDDRRYEIGTPIETDIDAVRQLYAILHGLIHEYVARVDSSPLSDDQQFTLDKIRAYLRRRQIEDVTNGLIPPFEGYRKGETKRRP